jgi:hypothetical protein
LHLQRRLFDLCGNPSIAKGRSIIYPWKRGEGVKSLISGCGHQRWIYAPPGKTAPAHRFASVRHTRRMDMVPLAIIRVIWS